MSLAVDAECSSNYRERMSCVDAIGNFGMSLAVASLNDTQCCACFHRKTISTVFWKPVVPNCVLQRSTITLIMRKARTPGLVWCFNSYFLRYGNAVGIAAVETLRSFSTRSVTVAVDIRSSETPVRHTASCFGPLTLFLFAVFFQT